MSNSLSKRAASSLKNPPETLSRGREFRSARITRRPCRARCAASTPPAGPPPMTSTHDQAVTSSPSGGGAEQHAFGGESRAEGHRTASGALRRLLPHKPLQDKQDRWGRHVSIVLENAAGGRKGRFVKFERVLDSVEHTPASRMDCPHLKLSASLPGEDAFRTRSQRVGDRRGNLAREEHVETGIANLPGDLV